MGHRESGRARRTIGRWALALALQAAGVLASAAPAPGPASVAATLATFRPLDPYPAYTMTYVGDYGLEALLAVGARDERELLRNLSRILPIGQPDLRRRQPVGMACTGFTARSQAGEALFGHNEDWTKRSYLVLATKPPMGYASLSVVDVGGRTTYKALKDKGLLTSPFLPLAGVNSEGLAVSTYTVPTCQPPFEARNVTLYWPVALRLLLDRAKTVEEAVRLLGTCNLSFADGNRLQFLVGDAQGDSAVIEWIGERTVVVRRTGRWQVVTNFLQQGLAEGAYVSCWRYRKAQALLEAQAERVTEATGAELLAQTAQPGATQFSVLFNLSRRTMRITFGWEPAKVYRFACP